MSKRDIGQQARPERSGLRELVIIVVGILLAFQVEEWRDRRTEQRDVRAALERLREEVTVNLERCGMAQEMMAENVHAVEQVFFSLSSGQVIDGDRELFERGLVVFDVVPDLRMNVSVANEMLATGLLKEVEDTELRQKIARLPASEQESSDRLGYWRAFIIELFRELMPVVEFTYVEGSVSRDALDMSGPSSEDRMQVDYDFDALAGNKTLRNLFFEAVDVHGDVLGDFRLRCQQNQEIALLLDNRN